MSYAAVNVVTTSDHEHSRYGQLVNRAAYLFPTAPETLAFNTDTFY